MKKIFIPILITLIMSFNLSYAQNSKANLVVNSADIGPVLIIKDNRTYCPIRIISEKLGYKVSYTPAKKTVTIFNGSNNISIKVGAKDVKIGNKTVKIDSPAFIEKSTTYVPIRLISEAFSSSVTWNNIDKTAVIMSSNPSKSLMKHSYVYKSPLGYSINLPIEQQNNILIMEYENCSEFYVKKLYENPEKVLQKEGLMFTVVKTPSKIEHALLIGAYNEGYFYFVSPSEVMTPINNVSLTQDYAITASGVNPYVQTIRVDRQKDIVKKDKNQTKEEIESNEDKEFFKNSKNIKK